MSAQEPPLPPPSQTGSLPQSFLSAQSTLLSPSLSMPSSQTSGPPPPPEQRYWRGPVLWQTDGRHWSAGMPAVETDVAGSGDTAALNYEVTLEPTGEPDRDRALAAREVEHLGFGADAVVAEQAEDEVRMAAERPEVLEQFGERAVIVLPAV